MGILDYLTSTYQVSQCLISPFIYVPPLDEDEDEPPATHSPAPHATGQYQDTITNTPGDPLASDERSQSPRWTIDPPVQTVQTPQMQPLQCPARLSTLLM